MKAPRFPAIKLRADGSKGCRGCGGDIPKGRLTWCSQPCKELFDPYYVKQAVKKRCGEKCENCGLDCSRTARHLHASQKPKAPDYIKDCGLTYPYDDRAWMAHPLYVEYVRLCKAHDASQPIGEFDHIVPHSEGGLFVLENIRMLCRACHRERTRQWHKARAYLRKTKEDQLAML